MIFKWESLRELGLCSFGYENPISGKKLEVELLGGGKIEVWRADDGKVYFCHGLTFGGKEAPGGAISPLGSEVPTILRQHFLLIPEE